MKNLILKFTAILMMAGVCFGCDDDDEEQIFQGIDNRIASFVLNTVDGGLYRAAIVGDEIILQVPDNVSLEGAVASYEISEQAILYPDPAKTTDWEDEHRFRVMAYDKTLRDYAYRLVRTPVTTGSVNLLTQADVDAFATTGATVVEGDLIIGGYTHADGDSIKDLSALAKVTDVRYNVIVNNSFAGKRIEMPALRSAGGMILGTSLSELTTADTLELALPAVETLGQLSANCTTLSSISMPLLRSVSGVRINASELEYLDLQALTVCSGDLSVVSGERNSDSNQKLKEISCPVLEQVKGTLDIRFFAALQYLNFPKLGAVDGNLNLEYLTGMNALSLPELVKTGGMFNWNRLTKVTTFSAPKLVSTAGFILSDDTRSAMLAVVTVPVLEDVRGNFKVQTKYSGDLLSFPALKRVDGELRLQGLTSVLEVQMPELAHCRTMYLSALNVLESLDLSKCGTIEKIDMVACYKLAALKVGPETLNDLILNGGSRLCDFTQITGTDRIMGKLEVTNFSQNEDLSFPGIRHIGTYRQTSGLTARQVLSFPDLETVDELQMTSCRFLKRLDAPKLKEVGIWNTSFMQYIKAGDLNIPALRKIGEFNFQGGTYSGSWSNMQLASMDDFSGVVEIGKVNINGWGNLTDFEGLKNAVPSIQPENWTVINCKYSPSLDDMKAGKFTE